MKMLPGIACAVLLTLDAHAAGWQFGAPIAVTGPPASGVFHHLEGAGRKHIAQSGDSIAAAWEDNRGGDPQVYVAVLTPAQKTFGAAQRVSSGAEAYEPAIAALPGKRFAIAWEQDGGVYLRLLAATGLGKTLRLDRGGGGQASLASHADNLYATWRERIDGLWFLRVARLGLDDGLELDIESSVAVEKTGLSTPLLLPSLAMTDAGLCVAWEDRREGHTRLLFAHSGNRGASFTEPQNLNEFFSGRNQYDQGSGVTRVSLAAFAGDEILAAWMDKRRGGAGYGIFGALGADGGDLFGPNEKVHGADGDRQPHYNPATAGNRRGDFVVAWDDFRRGDSDVWLSTYNEDEEWGEDYSPPVASGGGEQSHPAVALGDDGDLHLLWMERAELDAPSRLWYSRGRAAESQ